MSRFAIDLVIAALLVCACVPAVAQTWLTASIASYHFERGDYCELNPGVGFEHRIRGELRFVAGGYQNSYCRASSYAGASWMPIGFGELRAGAALIAVSGYELELKRDAKKDRLIVAPLPTLAWEGRRHGVNLVLLPPHDGFRGALGVVVKAKLQ